MAAQGAIASNIWGGVTYPSNFIGPIRPQDNRVGQSAQYAAPRSTGQVLGAKTSTIGGGGARAAAPAPQGTPQIPSQQNNVPAGPSQADIDAAFNPEFDALNQIQSGLESTRDSQLTGAQGKHDNQAGVLGGQVTGLQNNLAKNKLDWNNNTQGAYADALRAYNALQQRNNGLYGGQSSAGQAANDLLNQTYLQTRGGIGQQDASAQLAFTGQDQDIQNWSADQHAKLDNWLLDAQNQIKNVFQQGINQINADRGQAESAKSQAKLNLLQQLFTHQQQLQDYDNQLRMQVELAAKNLPQATYDSTNFNNQIGNYGQAVQNATGNFLSSAQITPSFNYNSNPVGTTVGTTTNKKGDPFANLA